MPKNTREEKKVQEPVGMTDEERKTLASLCDRLARMAPEDRKKMLIAWEGMAFHAVLMDERAA